MLISVAQPVFKRRNIPLVRYTLFIAGNLTTGLERSRLVIILRKRTTLDFKIRHVSIVLVGGKVANSRFQL